jgi:nonsense-mediated mRNA decay protein 3
MFCIKCGKPAAVGNFCDEHFLEKERLFELGNIRIDVCNRCDLYFDGEWKKTENLEDAVKDVIKKNIITKNDIKNIEIKLKPFGNKFSATVRCTGIIKPCKKMKTEEKKILVTISKKKCDNCVKVLGKYYEAVIQVRGDKKDAILQEIKKMISDSSLSGFKELVHGYDLFVIKKADANRIAKRLGERYEVKRSFKFATEKKGKKLYRNYFAVR